ncbi:hypothetical protein [Roseateles asaccharophilus]|uniref:hypothetical protein n=1 Tax=Roseateles asaccharophilus TaxID=582607 RepID=UPI00384C560A
MSQHDGSDLSAVAGWLKCDVDDLDLVVSAEPIQQFMTQIQQMMESYPEFPAEARRTDKIERLLRAGKPAWPVYVERGDQSSFVMEGRHRIVALYRMGVETIQVCRAAVVRDKVSAATPRRPKPR